jgi:hypothetical protein
MTGIGPQIGFIFAARAMQGPLNFKAYAEFRCSRSDFGRNAWITFVVSSVLPAPATPRSLATK